MQVLQCKVPGCDKHANRKAVQLCEMHYGRIRRNGTYENLKRLDLIQHSNGYLLAVDPYGKRDYQHRIVYAAHHGNGPFACYWCGKISDFKDMHVDHLDNTKTNNHIANLAATCPTCNMSRGHDKMRNTVRSKFGIEFNGETRTWNEWAKHLGISRSALLTRLEKGWPLERVLTEPRGKFGPKSKQLASQQNG